MRLVWSRQAPDVQEQSGQQPQAQWRVYVHRLSEAEIRFHTSPINHELANSLRRMSIQDTSEHTANTPLSRRSNLRKSLKRKRFAL